MSFERRAVLGWRKPTLFQWRNETIAAAGTVVESRLAADGADNQIGQLAVKSFRAEHQRRPRLRAGMAGERDIHHDDLATPKDSRRASPPRLPRPY
jgi:hypothetical protein